MTDNFAQALKSARAATGLSQQGMADRMLIPKRTIEKWETGERTPPPYVQRFVLNELESLKRKEVKYGKWIYHHNDTSPTESTQECSRCHEQEYMTLHNENFCPNCGAKMSK